MKDKIFAVAILVVVLVAVVTNTLVLNHKIDGIIKKTEVIDASKSGTKSEADEVFDYFMREQKFISLTVSHDDMTQIEEDFTELVAYLDIGDTEGAEVAKSRLIRSLKHLRRLSSFNIDSII